MMINFDAINFKHINQVPLAALVQRAGTTPILLDCLLPGIDLVIWKMRPCVREPIEMELRQAAIRVLDHAVETEEPGAMIYELDGFSFFAFREDFRDAVLAEMGITKIVP